MNFVPSGLAEKRFKQTRRVLNRRRSSSPAADAFARNLYGDFEVRRGSRGELTKNTSSGFDRTRPDCRGLGGTRRTTLGSAVWSAQAKWIDRLQHVTRFTYACRFRSAFPALCTANGSELTHRPSGADKKPLPEVRQPYFDVLLFAGELVVFTEPFPAVGAIVRFGGAVTLEGKALGELAGGFVNDDAGGTEVVTDFEEGVARVAG